MQFNLSEESFPHSFFYTMERLRIRDMAEADRPREKLLEKGPGALSDAELLAILLGSGNQSETVVQLAQRILLYAKNNLHQLGKLGIKELTREFKGVGTAKATTLVAALELGKRRLSSEVLVRDKITCSTDLFSIFYENVENLSHEEFWILLLSRSMNVLAKIKIGQGGLSETTADIKVIMHHVLSHSASGLVLCHNHPSGNLTPSQADDKLTDRVHQAAKLFDIYLVDHIIIGNNSYYSYADEGRLLG